jgi:hypothetical protein
MNQSCREIFRLAEAGLATVAGAVAIVIKIGGSTRNIEEIAQRGRQTDRTNRITKRESSRLLKFHFQQPARS